MAALALASVLTEVNVVLLMAGQAGLIEFHLVRRLLVAALTGQLAVGSAECEAGLLAMIEFPQPPTIRRVALRAVRPEAAVMHVIGLVALVAAAADVPISACAVALLAGHGYVQAHQRIGSQVMVERDGGFPTFGGMAFIASRTQLARVDVAGTVATGAVGRQLLSRHDSGVTGIAADLLMPSGQIPVPVTRVIEQRRFPLVVVVALFTLCAEATRV